ncbi:Thioredoxin-like protein [Glarea lozoyensis ATCC 20868]|uniref:Thioredoxin-like protein n=1 Tax=Glarea lozoyensis (strain ATCC 20868 / MF5171) TaxID=1116229 RepID=S3CTR4_GLAL2|nr:Thioredoxin-like protein [Glarea lozoyensis ATCC 20868]EPE29767.1 Thioredoxin-like protein [Glarea lozoyensis ATCC 20868]
MALAPKFAGQKFSAAATPTLHTLELYLDYVCPFSAKMFDTIYTSVIPLIKQKYPSKVQILFRQQALFDDAKSYYDVNLVNETRNQTYERLSKLGATVGLDEKEMLKLLWINDKPAEDGSLNTGNAVTNDLKVLVKMNRLVGVHVTPTVLFDGVVENSISSSFTGDQWAEWLEKNVA